MEKSPHQNPIYFTIWHYCKKPWLAYSSSNQYRVHSVCIFGMKLVISAGFWLKCKLDAQEVP